MQGTNGNMSNGDKPTPRAKAGKRGRPGYAKARSYTAIEAWLMEVRGDSGALGTESEVYQPDYIKKSHCRLKDGTPRYTDKDFLTRAEFEREYRKH